MTEEFKKGDLAKVIKKGPWFGICVRITGKTADSPVRIYQVEVERSLVITFFAEDELKEIFPPKTAP